MNNNFNDATDYLKIGGVDDWKERKLQREMVERAKNFEKLGHNVLAFLQWSHSTIKASLHISAKMLNLT